MTRPLLVAICTHNPRPDFFQGTLAALRAQTLPPSGWDLLVVDNASTIPLADGPDLWSFPRATVVREEKLGTAHARRRALQEANARGTELLLFVDDDNLLAPDYLAQGQRLGETWPQLGCWGGQLLPRYETEPPAWIRNYLNYLAVTPLAADRWTNCVTSYDSVPPTAGCFIRAAVWQRYLELITQDPRRLALGARGTVQLRGEDTDLVLTAIDLGLGVARFRDLQLDHLIPAGRLTPAYVSSLVEGTATGIGMMEYLRFNRRPARPARRLLERILLQWRTRRLPEPLKTICLAELRGRAAAVRTVRAWEQQDSTPRRQLVAESARSTPASSVASAQ